MNLYQLVGGLTPSTGPPISPQRILIVRPCCIGDVVMATAALAALRRAYPGAHISWAVGGWSGEVLRGHPLLDDVLMLPPAGAALNTPGGFWVFIRAVRAGGYDLVVSLMRTPRMSAALLLAGVPFRAGLNSAGRGFGYNIRADIDPHTPRHEVEVYLAAIAALGIDTADALPTAPVSDEAAAAAAEKRREAGCRGRYLVVNPSGGNNPGAIMDEKRYPPAALGSIARGVAQRLQLDTVVIVAGPGDDVLAGEVRAALGDVPSVAFVGTLSFQQVGAVARDAVGYIGNDTGLTHLAAAAGGRVVMIFGPTDPVRYRPYSPNAIYLWRPYALTTGGVADGAPIGWSWERDGIDPQTALNAVLSFLQD